MVYQNLVNQCYIIKKVVVLPNSHRKPSFHLNTKIMRKMIIFPKTNQWNTNTNTNNHHLQRQFHHHFQKNHRHLHHQCRIKRNPNVNFVMVPMIFGVTKKQYNNHKNNKNIITRIVIMSFKDHFHLIP